MRMKILIVCVCCTFTALVMQTFLFQKASARLISGQAKSESYHTLENMQNEIYTFIKNIESNMIEIYNNRDFLTALGSKQNIEAIREDYYRLAYTIAAEEFETSDGVVALYLYTIDNEIISTYRRATTPKHNYPKDIYEDSKLYNADVVTEYMSSDDTSMLISSYYNIHREKDIIRFVLKIYDSSNLNDKVGYIVCDIDSKVLEKIMKKYVTNEEMYIWLQPAGDRQLYAIGMLEEENQTYHDMISSYIISGEIEEVDDFSDSNRVFFQVSQDKYNLGAYSIMPQSILEENQKVLSRNLIFIAVVVCVLMSVLYFYVTRSLTSPLEKLMQTIGRIRSGETELRADYEAKDEIGMLGTEFNNMLDEMESLIGQQYEAKLLLNKAEYKALQAQINPHFLYNTLDTMSSIASIQNCEMVSNLCQSLSNIFRYSLDMKHPYVTVAKEIGHLKNYIYVMNVRMREEIKYIFEIGEDVLQDMLPRISLQPLVENALTHGLKNKHGEKYIKIKAEKKGGILCICVEDNGTGMDAERMNARLKENDTSVIEEGSSIGLLNINARLKMAYGIEYGLYIESSEGCGTTVLMKVPEMKEETLYGKENV
ncbi:MAG: sensor histidine kinase [Eubacterium sp.]|nr:sensor histidine kinase [Eubacterium sp.]